MNVLLLVLYLFPFNAYIIYSNFPARMHLLEASRTKMPFTQWLAAN